MQRNKFEEDYRTIHHPIKFSMWNSPGVSIIGGENILDANIITTKKNTDYLSIAILNCGPVKILKNIFSCNSSVGSTTEIRSDYTTIPFVQVDLTTATSVS